MLLKKKKKKERKKALYLVKIGFIYVWVIEKVNEKRGKKALFNLLVNLVCMLR